MYGFDQIFRKNDLSAKDNDHDLEYSVDLDLDLDIDLDLDPDLYLVEDVLLWALCLSDLDSLHQIFRKAYLSAKDYYHDLGLDLHLDLGHDLDPDLDI